MAIGKFDPQESRPEGLKDSVRIVLDEALMALLESFHDLTDEQAWARPLPGRHNIVTLILHMQHNIDMHACFLQTGKWVLQHDPRFDVWQRRDPGDPERQHDLPAVQTLLERQQALQSAVLAGLDQASEADLFTPRAAEAKHWWRNAKRNSLSAYLRVVCHTNAHVRQVWLLRGVMGATDAHRWPQQHYH
jgi:hypothetical protein